MALRVTARSTTDLVLRVLREAREPLTVEEILSRVQKLAPVHSANPKNTMRKAISQMFLVQSTRDGRYAYLPYLLADNHFRHPISREELLNRYILLSPELVTALWPSTYEIAKRRSESPAYLQMAEEQQVEVMRAYREVEGWAMEAGEDFWGWLEGHTPHPGDELVFSVVDAEARRYGLRFARREDRPEGEIAERNLELANQAEGLLKAAHDAVILSSLAVRLIGLGVYHHPIPPDPLATVLHNDPRFVDAGLDLVALADRWPGYPSEPVDYRRLSANVSPAARLAGTPEVEEVEEEL